MPEFLAVFPEGVPYAIHRELRLGKAGGGEGWRLTFTDEDLASAQPDWRSRKIASGV